MSLLSRFTSIFSSSQTTQVSSTPINQQLQEILAQIINSNGKLNLKQKGDVLAQYLLDRDEHIEFLFQFLETRSKDLSGVQVVNLLAAIHQQFQYNELIQDVAIKLRETKMSWVQLEKQEWYSTQTEPDQQKNLQTQKILTEFEDKAQPAKIYAQLCYVYLQKLAANVDLYRAVLKLNYPYITEKDYIEAKLIFLWHYKIQNLINSGSILIQFNPNLIDIQVALYYDVCRFQKFICTEIEKIIDQYATLPNSDTLSLYEIYCESQRHYEHLNQFHQFTQSITQPPPQCQINNTLLQEFFAFVTKLKVLNQFNFKKSIKVPNKQDPIMGIPTKNPNVLFHPIFFYFRFSTLGDQVNNQMINRAMDLRKLMRILQIIKKQGLIIIECKAHFNMPKNDLSILLLMILIQLTYKKYKYILQLYLVKGLRIEQLSIV